MAGAKYVFDKMAVSIIKETTSGTYLAPTVVLPFEKGAGVPEPKFETDVSDPQASHHGSKETTVITDFAEVSYDAKLKLPDDHTLIAVALGMCGLVPTPITGGVEYAYDSTQKDTCSLLWTEERTLTKAYGARADFSLLIEVGKAAEASFGISSMLKEVANLTSVETDNAIPAVPALEKVFMTKKCDAYLVNGNSLHFEKVEFKQNAEVMTPKDTCPGPAYILDTKPELSIKVANTEENEGAFADLKSGTEFNFIIPLYNMAGDKKWELVAPKCVAISQGRNQTDGRLKIDRTLECRRVNGDDNWALRAYD